MSSKPPSAHDISVVGACLFSNQTDLFRKSFYNSADTYEDRGILSRRETPNQSDESNVDNEIHLDMKIYDNPFVTKYISRWKHSKYIPFFPTLGARDPSKLEYAEAEVVFNCSDGGMMADDSGEVDQDHAQINIKW